MKRLLLVAASLLLISSTHAIAQSKEQTKPYVGLNWYFGQGITPELTLGVMHGKTKADGDTDGANLSVSFGLASGFAPASIKLGYLNGKEDFQGNIGLGYSFQSSQPLMFVGVNAPYSAFGLDVKRNFEISPYLQLHSHGKFKEPTVVVEDEVVVANPDPGPV